MKTVDIAIRGLGRCPKYPQGTRPLTHHGLCPNPSSPEGRKRAQLPLFCLNRIIRKPYVKELSRHILVQCTAVFHGFLDNGSAPVMQLLGFAYLVWSADQERLEVATFRAYYQHLLRVQHH